MRGAPGLVSRDLAALFAFGAVALPGVLPVPVLLAFPASFGLSLLGVRPLSGRRTASVVVLLAIAVGLFGAVAFSTLDLVVAAVSFATLVTCHRMLAEPTPEATRQVLLSGLLLVSGGAALTGEVLFAALLVGFFVFATWSLAWIELGPEARNLEVGERRAVSRRLVAGSLATLAMGGAFFVLFPRLSWNLATRRAAPGLGGVSGMSDKVRLGGGGEIKTNTRVALRVQLLPDPGTERLDAYFVGRHFDVFDGSEWTASGAPTSPSGTVMLNRDGKRSLRQVSQDFEATPAYGSRTLIALDTPTFFGRVRGLTVSGSLPMPVVHVPGDQVFGAVEANSLTYAANSDLGPSADRTPPGASHTDVPRLDPRTRALADELAGAADTPAELARTLEAELKRRYEYTLQLPGEVDDPLSDFLFTRRAGHCEDFATALAILLRLKGVPTRVATGFYGGERAGARYVIRAGDAHAWTEAWVDGAWVRLDATPDTGRSAASNAMIAATVAAWERLEEWWRSRIVDYSFQDQITLARQLVRPPADAPQQPAQGASEPVLTRGRASALVAALGLLALLVLVRRSLRARPHPASSFLDELEARLRSAGVADASRTPIEELSKRLSEGGHPLGPAVTRACRRYLEARFGGAPLEPGERRALLEALETTNR